MKSLIKGFDSPLSKSSLMCWGGDDKGLTPIFLSPCFFHLFILKFNSFFSFCKRFLAFNNSDTDNVRAYDQKKKNPRKRITNIRYFRRIETEINYKYI